jgi:threonine dehydratase
MADGLLTALSERTFAIMLKNVDDVLVVKEQSIMKAMKLVFQYLKIVIEPSSAVPLAAVIDYPEVFNGKKVAIILSGGNVDLPNLPF